MPPAYSDRNRNKNGESDGGDDDNDDKDDHSDDNNSNFLKITVATVTAIIT